MQKNLLCTFFFYFYSSNLTLQRDMHINKNIKQVKKLNFCKLIEQYYEDICKLHSTRSFKKECNRL